MDETSRMLALLNESFPDLTVMAPQNARAAADARIGPASNIDDIASTEDRSVDAQSRRIAVRVYHPHAPRPDAPVTVYAHGGGFLHGSIEGHDGFCRRWAKGTGSVVVSVDYRLAPEATPAEARGDVVAAVDWALENGLAAHGVVVAGDSSGGTLAAGAAVALRDRGSSPVVGQVLAYPFLDPTMATESYRTRATGYFVTAALLAYYWRTALGEKAIFTAEDTPLVAEDLAGLPPAIVLTAGLDPLCDEGTLYARRLREAGVRATLRHHPDQFHGFLTVPGYGPAESAAQTLWSDIHHLTTSPKESR